MPRVRFRTGFNLVELVCVAAVISTLAYISIVAAFPDASSSAKTAVMKSDMANISRAFQQAYDDAVLTDAQLEQVAAYGLWPLFQKERPNHSVTTFDISAYDAEKNRGWRGPYASASFRDKKIDAAATGQPEDSSGAAIPGILDPYGGYYRVIMPATGDYRKKRLALVCTGANETLDTGDAADSNGYIAAESDDAAILLIPLAP